MEVELVDWDADFEMDDELALRLVREQFRRFDGERATKLGSGWDNVAFLIDGRAVFRFPRRAFSVPFLKRETVWLRRLSERLEMPIPVPRWIGEPTEEFDRPFVGYEYLPGTTMDATSLTRAERTPIAAPVGKFCRELHDLEMSEYGTPPHDLMRRRDLDRRMAFIDRRAVSLRSRGVLRDEAILALARDVRDRAEDDGEERWVHGDLYARHVLVSGGEVTGIVDWGDLHYGDLAVDLSIAWTAFDFDGRCEFFAAYGDADDHVRYRAILRAIHYALTLLDYGHDIDDGTMVREGEGALEELLSLEL